MPSYIVTCKQDASDEDVQAVKQHSIDQGGKISHEYSLIKGFAVEFPDSVVNTLESHPHVENVEADSEVKTQ
ncbi:hypothetical protein N7508_002102 [Penicillium antarcticum]|uniref:uncharacterized protein n=1 Tax=Penicillium antarcticum TaxID=416450 RepID=UPI0023A403FC|nr:uncharacterized protein N7508_002102 [Penicillium antarcticum]KAJ5317594.1 hypothetical protein N7508_002102 [Penicillium antarcticum]